MRPCAHASTLSKTNRWRRRHAALFKIRCRQNSALHSRSTSRLLRKSPPTYRGVGVAAEIIAAKTPLAVRGQLIRQFRARNILQLVSVDVLGEGVVDTVARSRSREHGAVATTASFRNYTANSSGERCGSC